MTKPDYARRLFFALALLALWRLLTAMHVNMELFGDEAQYWTWALAPDFGYYSKPPMIAWAIWLGTWLFGDGELGVRAISVFVYPLTGWLLFLLVRRLFRGDAHADAMGFWTGLIYAALPMVSLGSWLITTDAFLLLFWSLSLYQLSRALDSGRWRDWLLLGAAIGLGLMSKYSMVFFGFGLAVYLASSPTHRRLFLDPRPYGAALVALLVVAPNLIWNAQHAFVSFQHTAEISQLDKALFHPKAMLEFFAGQFLVFGPITFAALVLVAVRPKTWWADERMRFLAAFALAPLAAFLCLSLLSRSFANWGAFSYAAGSALVAASWLIARQRKVMLTAIALNLLIAAGLYNLHDIASLLDVQLTRKTDPYGRVTGYRALGVAVSERLRTLPEARLLTDDRKLYALLRYYARPLSDNASYFNLTGRIDNHYALTADFRQAPEGEFLVVSEDDIGPRLGEHFAQVARQAPIALPLYPDHTLVFQVWRASGYRANQ